MEKLCRRSRGLDQMAQSKQTLYAFRRGKDILQKRLFYVFRHRRSFTTSTSPVESSCGGDKKTLQATSLRQVIFPQCPVPWPANKTSSKRRLPNGRRS